MPQTLKATGQRTDRDTGEVESIEFSYVQYSSVNDAVTSLTEARVLKDLNRMVKTDARNLACAPKQSEEQKAAARERGKKMRELFAKISANPSLAEELGITL